MQDRAISLSVFWGAVVIWLGSLCGLCSLSLAACGREGAAPVRAGGVTASGAPATVASTGAAGAAQIRVDVTPGHAKNTFRPAHALSAGIDRMPRDSVDKLYAPESLRHILSSGWGAARYRLTPELHVDARIWN